MALLDRLCKKTKKCIQKWAKLFVQNKYMYTSFSMGGTVALRSVNNVFLESYSAAAKRERERERERERD
jgi:hypothetical protein